MAENTKCVENRFRQKDNVKILTNARRAVKWNDKINSLKKAKNLNYKGISLIDVC